MSSRASSPADAPEAGAFFDERAAAQRAKNLVILVTGASGFVGQHVVIGLRRSLPASRIRAFDAEPSSAAWPDGVETAYGLVEEREHLPDVVRGADVVIHLAAKVEPDSRESKEMWRVNVEGTRNVYSAAVASRCKLFLHMSSAGIYGPPRSPDPFHEDDDPEPVTPYQRTKWEAEEALRHTDSGDATLNILRPAGIYGPGNHLAILEYRKLLNRKWAVEISGGVIVHPTHVEDVVQAIVALVAQPAPHGTTFNLGGERPIRLQDLHALAAEMLGVQRRRIVLPVRLAGPLAALAGPILGLRGRPNPLLGGISRGHLFSAAVDDRRFRLRYPDVPVVELQRGLREYLEWASKHRLL
ncbi:MAG: NAD(P)-dependent oxidoreductase [Actinobacteria bacterium]|nr:NAD(P)-dependent oxidoreductase [Actinomycetota bacterium]